MNQDPNYNATLIERIEITPDLLILRIKPDAPVAPFQAGQYVAIGLRGDSKRPAHFPPEEITVDPEKIVRRAYSIGSSPSERDFLEFYVAILPQGALTARLAALAPGDRINIAAKITGSFTLESVPQGAALILIATGTGLAPFISMVRTPGIFQKYSKVTIVHGVRYSSDFAYRTELLDLQSSRAAQFCYLPIVSRPEHPRSANWEGEVGRVQSLILDRKLPVNPAGDHIYLCGNPAMIDELEILLKERGFVEHSRKIPGNLHIERYW